MKSLFKAVALITIFSILTRAMGFLFRIYLSRTIGAEALGIYQIALSVFMVLITIVTSGIPLIVSRATAKYTTLNNKQAEKQVIGSAFYFSLIFGTLICLIVFLLKGVFDIVFTDDRITIILLILLPAVLFSGLFGTFKGWLWGKNNYFGVCLAELFEQFTRIIICVLMLSTAMFSIGGAETAALSLSIACGLSFIFTLIYFFACGGRIGKPKNVYSEIIKPSISVTLFRLLTSLVQPFIAIVIPLRLMSAGYTNSQALSLYGIAIGMTMPFLFIPSAIVGSLSMALIPDLSSAVTKQDYTHIDQRITTSLIFTMFFSAIFVPLFMGAGEQIGMFFYDNAQSGILLSKSAWLVIPIGLVNVSSSILNALGLEVKSLKNYVLGAIVLVLCVWFLPKYIGINALIWGMGLCTATASLLNIKMIKKHTGNKLNFAKPFWLMLAFILPVAALTSFTVNILTNFFNLFFSLAISCGLGGLFFVLLCFVFNLVDYQDMFVKIIPKKLSVKIKKLKTRKLNLPKFFSFKVKRKKVSSK